MAERTNETAELVTLLERGGVDALRRRLGITRHLAERTAWLLRRAHLEGRELAPEDIPRGTISARRQSASTPGEAAAVVPPPPRETPDEIQSRMDHERRQAIYLRNVHAGYREWAPLLEDEAQ